LLGDRDCRIVLGSVHAESTSERHSLTFEARGQIKELDISEL
jgi:hypothetical protein